MYTDKLGFILGNYSMEGNLHEIPNKQSGNGLFNPLVQFTSNCQFSSKCGYLPSHQVTKKTVLLVED